MHATTGTGDKARVGEAFPTLQLTATSGQLVTIPDPAGNFVHLQLRRFAGCPICNRHLHSIVTRREEIRSHGIREASSSTPPPRNWPSTRPNCRSR
jgi:peroxiredoxin